MGPALPCAVLPQLAAALPLLRGYPHGAAGNDVQQDVAQAIRFMQHESYIPDSRVYNIDEASCRMFPNGDLGWRVVEAPLRGALAAHGCSAP